MKSRASMAFRRRKETISLLRLRLRPIFPLYAVFLFTAAMLISSYWPAYASSSPLVSSLGEAHPFIPSRNGHSNTVMNDGRVLMVGGRQSYGASVPPLQNVEIFDPVTQLFLSAPPTAFAHIGHFALHLDDDRVVIAGGLVTAGSNGNAPVAYAPEIWDPVSSTWAQIKDIQFEANDEVIAGKFDDGTVLFVASNERSMRQSTRADATQFHAWLWDPKLGTVNRRTIPATPRMNAAVAVLHDGRVLITGGRPLIFTPEHRCEEIPAKQARAQGVANGDWCASHGVWDWEGGPKPNSELWDSRNGNVSVLDALPIPPFNLYLQTLQNGNVFVAAQYGPRFDESPAALWSVADGSWRKIANLPVGERLAPNQPLLELDDGTLLGHSNRYSLGQDSWLPAAAPVPSDTATLQLSADKTIALSTVEPYLHVLDQARQQWQVSINTYWRAQNNATLALSDGRLLVVGNASDADSQRSVMQLWNPKTDSWTLQKIDGPNQVLKDTQLVQLTTGDVLRLGLGENGMLECLRWPLNSNAWTGCGHFQLTADMSNSDKPAHYSFALGVLDDGRVLFVENQAQAQLFNEQGNAWSPVALDAQEQTLVQGAPIRLAEPLYRFRDEPASTWIDASSIGMRYKQSAQENYRADMLWDSRQHQWAYVFTDFRMGRNAALLPDGCAIALYGNHFRLFDPSTGKVTDLAKPLINISSPSMAVLADGTVAVAGSSYGIDDRKPGFFSGRASCKGFASEAGENTPVIADKVVEQAPAVAVTAAPSNREWLNGIWHGLLRYRWTFVAGIVPLLLYWVLKKIIRRLAPHDQAVNISPNVSFVLRLIIYGTLGLVFGPMLWSRIFYLTSSDASDEPNTAHAPWYQTVDQHASLAKDLSIPCRYVGFWHAHNTSPESTLQFRYSMYDDGHLEVKAVRDGMAREVVLSGNWAAHGRGIVWLEDDSDAILQINRIVDESASKFTLQQADGQYVEFWLHGNPGRTDCAPDSPH